MSDVLKYVALATLTIIAGVISYYFPDREDHPDDSWVHADLDAVPYVITQPEPRGHLLPWYRRVFARRAPQDEPPPPVTYRG